MEEKLEEMLLKEDDEILRSIGTALKRLDELETQVVERRDKDGGE